MFWLERYRTLVGAAARKPPRQLIGVLSRKAKNEIMPRLPVDFDGRYRRRVPDDIASKYAPHARDTERLRTALSVTEREQYRTQAATFADGDVTFLNRTRTVSDPATLTPADSRLTDLPRLWYLKLAAFEPLRWVLLGGDASADVLEHVETWVRAVPDREPIATRPGYLRGFWTPHAVSLRVLALCRYGGYAGGLPKGLEQFLYKNLCFLADHVETDVGGNHLFENGAALAVGGAAFPRHGQQFVDGGLSVLSAACEGQFLDDDHHYERSPMYHLAVTKRLLTTVSVLDGADVAVPDWLRETTTRACGYTSHLRPPDGRIPLLNDAVFDETDRLDSVCRYAAVLDLAGSPPSTPGESDLHWLGDDPVVLFDAGDSGPPTQLGHTHNDPCTVLAWCDGHRIVTDTGVFDYQPGRQREHARSVRGHNTVAVENSEPTAFGGRFAMSTAVPTTTARSSSDGIVTVTATYQAGSNDRYTHRRTGYGGPNWVLVWDELDEPRPWTSRLHAHPDVAIEGNDPVRLVHDAGPTLAVHPLDAEDVTVEFAPYFPQFGVEKDRDVLELTGCGSAFGYLLTAADADAIVSTTGGKPTDLHVDGELYEVSDR